jgi:hypothetical protein
MLQNGARHGLTVEKNMTYRPVFHRRRPVFHVVRFPKTSATWRAVSKGMQGDKKLQHLLGGVVCDNATKGVVAEY